MAAFRGVFAMAGLLVLAGACTSLLGDEFEIQEELRGGPEGAGAGGADSVGGQLGGVGGDVVSSGVGGGGAGGSGSGAGGSGVGGSGAGGSGAGGSGAGGSGSGAGGVGGSGAGGSGGAPVENCLNGIDDDGDTLPDCSDPDCSLGHVCVDVPPNWIGPLAFSRAIALPGACPGTYPNVGYRGFSGLQYDPVSCGACACGSATVDCELPPLSSWGHTGCRQNQFDHPWGSDTSLNCVAIASSIQRSFIAGVPKADVTCASSGGGVSERKNPTWDDAALVCEAATNGGGGCNVGKCFPKPPGGAFAARNCIYRMGDRTCPGVFTQRFPLHTATGYSDSRDCSGCGCAGSGSCNGRTRIYNTSSCGAAYQIALAPNDGVTCVNGGTSTAGGEWSRTQITSRSGSCTETGGTPQGTVVPTAAAATVCCAP